jgi:hypothetical protein
MSGTTLNGRAVTKCRVSLPAWGVWFAEAEIDTAEALTGAATLVMPGLTLVGTILSGGTDRGRARFRIAGGAGGWGRTVAAKAYANDVGVKHATILGDVARDCGETLGTVPAAVAGPAYTRAAGPAVAVLDDLHARGWYVDAAGVTQIGLRAATTYSGTAVRLRPEPASNRLELAPSTLEGLLPGAVIDGVAAVDVEHVLDQTLRTTVYGARVGCTGDVVAGPLAKAIELVTAAHRFFAPWEYRVVQRVGERLHLQAPRASSGMPNLGYVRVRPGVSGMRARPKLGSLVIVSFVDGDASRPMVVGFDDAENPGFGSDETALVATLALLGSASATDPVVRKSDLQDAIDDVRAWANTHTHPVAGVLASATATPLAAITATGSAVVKAV